MGIRFYSSEYFIFIFLIPVFYLLYNFYKQKTFQKIEKIFNKEKFKFLLKNYDPVKEKRSLYFLLIGIFFILIALARPQTPDGVIKVKNEGSEVILLVDVSRSMMAQDIKPSRLDIAKKELTRLVDYSSGDRFGLIAFAGSAVLLSPVTADREAIKMYIESLNTDTVSTQGTNLAKALSVAERSIEEGSLASEDSVDTRVSQSIIIASDGETHDQGTIDKVLELVQKKINVYTLAFGTSKGAPIPIYDRRGERRGYLTDKQGKTVMSQVKGDSLKEIASRGKGNFYQFSFQSDVIKKLADALKDLEKARFSEGEMQTYGELYSVFASIGFFFLLFSQFMDRTKKYFGKWRGRFENNK